MSRINTFLTALAGHVNLVLSATASNAPNCKHAPSAMPFMRWETLVVVVLSSKLATLHFGSWDYQLGLYLLLC